MFDTQQLTTLIIAALGSGGLSSIVTGLLSHRKNVVEIEQLKQQISDNEADTQIKLNEHIQKQMMELSETYKHEFENRTEEIKELRKQNELLKTRVSDLSNQINQLMTWVAYDSMRYQEWLEAELLQRDPNIQFPKFRKPPKFVQKFMEENNDAPDSPPQGFTETRSDE